jgi:sugar lactone lactonase YvrE
VRINGGLPSVEGLATDPQGTPFVSTAGTGGGIVRVLVGGAHRVLAETSGRPAGLAFDAAGDLYVADRQLRSVFRVKPWGALRVIAENLATPEAVAVGQDGEIYVTDSEASRIYRIGAGGGLAVFSTEVGQPKAIAISSDDGQILVAGSGNTIWRLSPDGKQKSRFAVFSDPGQVAGVAIDGEGNLYVARDGGGKVSVCDRDGNPIDSIAIPGPRVTGVAFGGYEMDRLFVGEAQAGAVYKVQVAHRSQRMPWEPGGPLRITWPADGAILNRHDGQKTAGGLRIPVRGTSHGTGQVRLNGEPVPVERGRFEGFVVLRERENKVLAETTGGRRHTVTVLWDRDSFPRYRFSTDDNIWFLRDIARNASKYRSIFDNPYLALWRDMHGKYGTKFHFNIYYETAGFDLSQMPDKFRSEWQRNSGWIRLTFHARANDPAKPYLQASAEQMREDYRLVTGEIERFAGKELLSPVTTLHWAAANRGAARVLREEGVKVLLGVDAFRDDLLYNGYYLSIPQFHALLGRDYWKDTAEDIIFLHHDIVLNHVPPDKVAAYLDRVASDPHESEVMELIIHEQYFYPEYRGYEPDYRQRVERALEWVTRRGYKPVFFGEGFLGTGPER